MFEDWLAAHRGEPPARALVEDGVSVLRPSERERIERSFARWLPGAWQSLCADVGGEGTAASVVLIGAVVAALAEERLPGDLTLALVDEYPVPADQAETLALCLDAAALWSVVEAAAADAALARLPDELDDDEYRPRGTPCSGARRRSS